ncbi:MAG: hypothetical protein NVSMB2_01720 [Chloroflexota bacterium]
MPRVVSDQTEHSRPPERGALRPVIGLLIALLLTALAYLQFLDSGFGATDSLPLVATSRFRGLGEMVHLFREPVMAGTRFVQGEVVYRPLPSVSLGCDYLLWGLNPFGYHLTNLLLHAAAVACVWFLLIGVGLRWMSATIGAAVFGLHPLVVATVPVIARRDSILPVLATTAAAALLMGSERTCSRARQVVFLSLAAASAAAGLLSKESAFPGLVLVAGLWAARRFASGASLAEIVRGAVRLVPLVALMIIVFAMRWSVIRGLGGGTEAASLFPPDLEKYSQTIGAFTRDLAWIVAGLASSTREVWPRLAALVLLGVLACSVALGRRYGTLLAMGTAWVVAFAVFAAVLKISTIAWLAYFALVGLALVVAAGLEGGLHRLRAPGPGIGWLASLGLVVATSVYVLATLTASPVVRRYDQWATAGAVTESMWSALTSCVQSHPSATRVVLANLPSTLEDGRVETNLLGVTLIEQYTVDAMLSLRAADDRALDTSVDGYETLRSGAGRLQYACASPAADTVRLTTIY